MLARLPTRTTTRAPGGRTNAYLVGRSSALLVDPPAPDDAIDAALADRTVAHLAVTHTHPDHVGGVAHYAAETGATVWAHERHAGRFERATGVAPDRTFREGTVIPADRPVAVVETPGHARDHVAFALDDGALVGDLAVASGSVFVGPRDGDMRAYLTALRRLHARDLDALYPGHGPVIEAPRTRLADLVAHRRDRERRVRAAVRDGACTLDEILDRSYEKDLTGVRDLAGRTVAAHLEKLAVEGAVTWDGERAAPT